MLAELPLSAARGFSGSYAPEDVTFLLKPVQLRPTDVLAKEALIQSGACHYSEMIGPERVPNAKYLELFEAAERRNRARLAEDVLSLAHHLAERSAGREIVLVSLARAGTPIGVLLVRLLRRLGHTAVHYSISIIRERGVDRNALAYIAARHNPGDAVFVDGWTGKGAIAAELRRSLADRPFGFVATLAVVADPAGQADIAPSVDDYLIASGLLNAVVSGLVSRSILSDVTVQSGDFHACVAYPHFAPHDLSRSFVEGVEAAALNLIPRDISDHAHRRPGLRVACEAILRQMVQRTGVSDRNRIKPGTAEATRTFLRRVPERLFLRDAADPDVEHLCHLAAAAGVPVEGLPPDCAYRAVAVIGRVGA